MARARPTAVGSRQPGSTSGTLSPEVNLVNIGQPRRIIEIVPEELPLPDPTVPMPEPGHAPVEPVPEPLRPAEPRSP